MKASTHTVLGGGEIKKATRNKHHRNISAVREIVLANFELVTIP